MRHLKNFKFVTGFVLFGSLFSSGIQTVMTVCGESQTSSNTYGAYQVKEALNRVVILIDNKITALQENDQLQNQKLLNLSRVLEEKEQKQVEELNALNTKLSTKLQVDSQSETLEKVLLKMQEILQQITAIKSEQTSMKEDITTLKSVQNGVAVKVQELSGINTDVAFLKAGQTNLINKVEEIIKEQNETFTFSREEFRLFSLPRDCTPKQSSGPYFINIAHKEVKVFCEMDSDGDPWTVIQKRVGPSKANESRQDFFLNWKEYEEGFGDVNEEHWIGLRNIAALTAAGDSELRIEMTDWEDNTRYAAYSLFKVGDSSTGYQLNIGNYSGTAGDSLAYHNKQKFSTKDKDQDKHDNTNCAEKYIGAWWYDSCHNSGLNGIHASFGSNGKVNIGEGIYWYYWKGNTYSLKKVTMMTRRKL